MPPRKALERGGRNCDWERCMNRRWRRYSGRNTHCGRSVIGANGVGSLSSERPALIAGVSARVVRLLDE